MPTGKRGLRPLRVAKEEVGYSISSNICFAVIPGWKPTVVRRYLLDQTQKELLVYREPSVEQPYMRSQLILTQP